MQNELEDTFIEDKENKEDVEDMKAKWYFSVPADTAELPEGTYTDYDRASFVTEEELTFKEAEVKAKELNAMAWIPVLD